MLSDGGRDTDAEFDSDDGCAVACAADGRHIHSVNDSRADAGRQSFLKILLYRDFV